MRKRKLTWEEVCEVRATAACTAMSYREIAERFGVAKQTIAGIVTMQRRVLR